MFTFKHLTAPFVTAVWVVLFSGKHRNKAHVTLGCGVNGGPKLDKWKHMVRTTETIECQHKDANRGANLSEDHEDRMHGWWKREKQGQQNLRAVDPAQWWKVIKYICHHFMLPLQNILEANIVTFTTLSLFDNFS